MIPAERQKTIVGYLHGKDLVKIDDLIETMGISLSTIRRDIKELVDRGTIETLRGGAVRLQSSNIELNLDAKLQMHREEKSRIARCAAQTVQDHDVLFIDPSSTNSLLIDHLAGKKVTVITNSIAHINKLVQLDISCILLGGQIKQSTSSCVGPIAEQSMRNLYFNRCFLGANGISIPCGITNHDLREQTIKRIAIQNSQESFFLIDSSKFGVAAMCKVAELSECTIITNQALPEWQQFENIWVAEP